MNRLRTINESLQPSNGVINPNGQIKGVFASCHTSILISEEDKVIISVHADVDSVLTTAGESVDKVKSDKISMLQRDLREIMKDAKSKIDKTVQKYDLNR